MFQAIFCDLFSDSSEDHICVGNWFKAPMSRLKRDFFRARHNRFHELQMHFTAWQRQKEVKFLGPAILDLNKDSAGFFKITYEKSEDFSLDIFLIGWPINFSVVPRYLATVRDMHYKCSGYARRFFCHIDLDTT